jgi:hypothetical protein
MKTLLLLTLLIAGGFVCVRDMEATLIDTKPQFSVSMKYNTEFDRYEVYAQANFTREHFILGPSQISIVVPKQIADQPLDVYSETGRWTDYSEVYAPAAAPDVDFHGIHTLGKSIDFQRDTPFILFSFSLKGGYTDGVRLYVNGKDPSSAQAGMMGGDFANTIQNHESTEFYQSAFDQVALAQLITEVAELGKPAVTVYPNPITSDAFAITVSHFLPGERLRLHLISSTGVELYGVEEETAKLVNYRVRVPRQLNGQAYLFAERTVATNGQQTFCKKLIILN